MNPQVPFLKIKDKTVKDTGLKYFNDYLADVRMIGWEKDIVIKYYLPNISTSLQSI